MNIDTIDVIIMLTYLMITVFLGIMIKKKSSQSQAEYMMGGKTLPWYMLGLSNASDMFDISGTMWMVSICYVYGFKSIWIVWLWPVFNQIFQMIYVSKWLRRSNVKTGAEWLHFRFGNAKGSEVSHLITVFFAIIGCLAFMAYGFIGLGKFIEQFIPWSWAQQFIPINIKPEFVGHFYGIIFTLFAVFYSLLGGMRSIVIGDVIMYAIMTISSLCIGIIAYNQLGIASYKVPEGWENPFFGWNLSLDWQNINPFASEKIASDGFQPWGLFFILMTVKGVIASLAGPAPNYDMQKILSTKSPEEASKMSGFVSLILLPIRYTMIIGFTILALISFDGLDTSSSSSFDFEKILPATIALYVPPIIKGIVLTGLMAAFMGTFSGTLNAAQSYFVNDIYIKYANPQAQTKHIMKMNYISGIALSCVSILIGLYAGSINDLLQWIVSGLYGGYVAANVLKWHWWRFNMLGYAFGMIAGVVFALFIPYLFPNVLALWVFPIVLLISCLGCIIGTYYAPPSEDYILKEFYTRVRPWGFWKPIHDKVIVDNPNFKSDANLSKDAINITMGIVGQCCLSLLPMYFIIGKHLMSFYIIAILFVIGLVLKRTWWNSLHPSHQMNN